MSDETSSSEALSPQEMGRKVYIDSSKAIAEASPKVAMNLGIAILVWMFGNLVFIPISDGLMINQYAVTQIISLIILATLAVLVLAVLVQIRRLSNAAAGIIAYSIGSRRGDVTQDELQHFKTALTGIVTVLIVAVAFLLFSANLNLIHPALTGIALIAAVLWMIVTLWRSGSAMAAEISALAGDVAKQLERRLT